MKKDMIIPDGMRAASFTFEGNKMTIFFEPEKYEPKVGDCVKIIYPNGNTYFCEVSDVEVYRISSKNVFISPERVCFENDSSYFTYDSIEKITPEEFQSEFEKLGYVYDFETHTAHKKRWRAEKYGDCYYLLNSHIKVLMVKDYHCEADDIYYNIGNYFKTKDEAEAKANEIKKLLKQ